MDEAEPELPSIGTTLIAKWWPGRYLLVSTIRLDGTDDDARLISSLRTGCTYEDAPPLTDTFVTQVVRCSYLGIPASWSKPLYEKEYATLEEAKTGHRKAVTIHPIRPNQAMIDASHI
jgi:hypothetical protein